jgi:hypothetical protein
MHEKSDKFFFFDKEKSDKLSLIKLNFIHKTSLF